MFIRSAVPACKRSSRQVLLTVIVPTEKKVWGSLNLPLKPKLLPAFPCNSSLITCGLGVSEGVYTSWKGQRRGSLSAAVRKPFLRRMKIFQCGCLGWPMISRVIIYSCSISPLVPGVNFGGITLWFVIGTFWRRNKHYFCPSPISPPGRNFFIYLFLFSEH